MASTYNRTLLEEPLARGLAWGAIGGLIAAIVTGIILQGLNLLTTVPAALVGSGSLAAGWVIHLFAGVVTGVAYGFLVRTRDVRRGLLLGSIFGLLVGIVAFFFLGNLLAGNALPFNGAGLAQVLVHLLWGALMGSVAARGLQRGHGRGHGARSRIAGPV